MPGLFQLRLISQVVGQPNSNTFENVFGYQSTLTVTDELNALADNFLANVLPAIQLIVTSDTYFFKVQIDDVNDPSRFLERNFALAGGSRSGDRMPLFTTWTYTYTRGIRGQKSGRKAFGAVSESDVTAGSPSGTIVPQLPLTAAVLAHSLDIGLIQTWFPVIISRPSAKHIDWQAHPIAGVVFSAVSTQNSRKR